MSTEALISIYEVCHDVATGVEMRPLLNRILARIMDLVKAERGFITPVASNVPLYDDAVQRISPLDVPFTRDFEVFSRSTVKHAITTGSLVSRSIQDNWGQATDSMRASGCRYVMAVPLQAIGEAVGVLYVDARQAHTRFSADDELLVGILARQAAIAIRQCTSPPRVENGVRRLAETLPQGILIVEDGRVGWCNPTVQGFFGSQLKGLNLSGMRKPDAIRTAEKPFEWQRALHRVWSDTRRSGSDRYEGIVALADGRLRTLRMTAHRYHVDQTEAVGIVVADVTEQREEEDRQFGVQRMESIKNLAGGMAHEFNNLLSVILGHADLLLSSGRLDESSQESVRSILDAVGYGSSISRQLLAFTGRVHLVRTACDLGGLVEDVARAVQHIAPRNINVVSRLDPERVSVIADRAQMHQALMNLALNALEAMSGGGQLTLETRFEKSDTADPSAIVLVSDTGSGIALDLQKRIFEPFFSSGGTHRPGLGLSTSHGIIKSHDGSLTFETGPAGTVFKVVLPASQVAPPTEGEEASAAAWRGHGELVLFVDDDLGLRTFGSKALEWLGFRAVTAGDGRIALQHLQEHKDIRAVVLDLCMPNMGGEECLRQLRLMDPHVPVLIASGSVSEIGSQELLRLGATAVLSKPFSLGAFRAALRSILEPANDKGDR